MKGGYLIYYCRILLVLALVFVFRVAAQFFQAFDLVSFLPPFDDWYSGALAYPFLLASQLIIILILVKTTWALYAGKVVPSHSYGRVLIIIGGSYFSVMLGRLLLWLFYFSNHSWFGATIPAVFHLALASFIIVFGHYHFYLGTKPNASK